jgi:hypothetical protein
MTLTGCALTPEARATELAWQAANLVDGVQTSQYRVNDCYESGDWKFITGREPTVAATVLAATISGALHYGITYALERFGAPRGLQRAWSYTTLALTAAQVAYNASLDCTR